MGSKSIETGTRFYVAFHDGLAYPVDAFLEWRVANTTAWKGLLEASGGIAVNKPKLLGGDKDQGGIVGTLRVMFGEADQMPNSYLVSTFGAQTAAWRGFLTVAYEGGVYGANNPYAQKRSYRIRRIKKGWDDDVCWYPEKAEVQMYGGYVDLLGDGWEYQIETFSEPNTVWDDFTVPEEGWLQGGELPFSTNGMAGGTYWTPTRSNIWLKRRMYVSATGVTLNIGADNGCVVWVDGVNVGSSNATNAPIGSNENNPVSFDFTATGEVEVVVKAFAEVNIANEAGNVVDLTFTGSPLVAMNPAHILYFLRTSRERGREPTANMADDSMRAAADYWYAKGFGLCGTRKAATVSPAEYEARICEILDCNFSRSVTDGLFYIDRSDGDYVLEDLPILTDDDVLDFKETLPVLDDAVNSVSVKYFDPVLKKEITSPAVRALGLIAAFGENHETLDYPEIPDAAMANAIALRKLLRRITPARTFELACTTAVAEWRRYQYFRLQLPKRGIADMVCLVASKVEGKLKSGGIQLTVVQDAASLDVTSYVGIEHGVDTRPPQTPVAITEQVAFEAPYFQVVSRLSRADFAALPDDVGYLVGAAVDPSQSRDFTMVTSPDGVDYAEAANGDFCPAASVIEGDVLYGTDTVPATNFTLEDGTLLDLVAVGDPALWGGEWCRVDAIDLEADPVTITLGRGCADTPPIPHAAGSRVLFCGDAFAGDTTEYSDGETIHAKLLTNTASEQLDEASATALDVTFDQRLARPYPPAQLRLNGDAYPAQTIGDLQVTFVGRDRGLQADQLVDSEMAGVGPEAGVTYTLALYDRSDDSLSYSEAGIASVPALIPSVSIPTEYRVEVVAVRGGLESLQPATAEAELAYDIVGNLSGGALDESYSQQLDVVGSTGTITWSVSSGALPAGLALDGSTGTTTVLQGEPTAAGSSTFDITAVDALGNSRTRTFTIDVGTIASLLHFDDVDGATTFTDSVAGVAWTLSGTGNISDDWNEFGGTSLYLNLGRIRTTSTPPRSIGTGAMTWAGWVNAQSLAATRSALLQLGTDSTTTNRILSAYVDSTGAVRVVTSADASGTLNAERTVSPAGSVVVGVPCHIEISAEAVASGKRRWRVFVNGVKTDEWEITGASLSCNGYSIGQGYHGGVWEFLGYFDEVKLVSGAVLHRSDFDPPSAASDYPTP